MGFFLKKNAHLTGVMQLNRCLSAPVVGHFGFSNNSQVRAEPVMSWGVLPADPDTAGGWRGNTLACL